MEFLVSQFVSIASCHVTGHRWEEIGSIVTASHQYLYKLIRSPGAFSFQAEQSHLLASPHMQRFPSCNQLNGPSLHSWSSTSMTFLIRQNPKVATALQMCLTRSEWAEGNHLFWRRWQHPLQRTPGCCWPPLPQGRIAGSCSTWCLPGAPRPFLPSCFPSDLPPACAAAWGYLALHQVPGFAAPCTDSHQQISPVWSGASEHSTTIWRTDHSYQFCTICELAQGALCPTIQTLEGNVNLCWDHYQSLGTPLVTGFPLDFMPTLWVQQLSQFSSFHCLACTSSVSLQECNGKRCQKPH